MSRRRTCEEKKSGLIGRPTDRFARLGHKMLLTPAYRALTPNARALLVELAMMENGGNNGVKLYLSVRDAADRMGVVDLKAASAAFKELEDLGFVAMTADAHFAVKAGQGSRARFWRLTWQAVNGQMGPTFDYEKGEPQPKTAAHRRMDRGLRALARWRKTSKPTAKGRSGERKSRWRISPRIASTAWRIPLHCRRCRSSETLRA